MIPLRRKSSGLGYLLVLLGAAMFAFGWLGFSIVAFAILIGGAVAFVVGLFLLRPTGWTLFWLVLAVGFVTFPVWFFLLVAALID